MEEIEIVLEKEGVGEQTINLFSESFSSGDHSKLENLDFKNSGHTGFQPAGDYALKTDIPNVSNFATKDEIPSMPTIPKNLSEFNNDIGYIKFKDIYQTELLNIEYTNNIPTQYENSKIYMVNGVPYGYVQTSSEPTTMQIWRYESGNGGPGEVFTYELANDPNLVGKNTYWVNGSIDYEAEVQPMPEFGSFTPVASIGQDTMTTVSGAIYRKYKEIKFAQQSAQFRVITKEDDLTAFIKNNVSNWYLEDRLNELRSDFETEIGDIDSLLISLNTGSGV